MNILHLNESGSRSGGVEGYIADISSALRQQGHSSLLVHFSLSNDTDLIPDMRYAPLPPWPAPPTDAVRVIEQVISAFCPDVVLVHALYHPTLIQWIARRLPTVAYVHGPYPVCPGSAQYLYRRSRVCPHKPGPICLVNAQLEHCCWGRNPLRHARLLRRVHAFVEAYAKVGAILVGSHFMQQLLRRGGIPSEKLGILPPVLFQEPWPPLTFSADSKTILFAGRLVREKGLQYLIRALATIGTECELVVAGEGQDGERCRVLAAQLGMAHRVHFMGWLNGNEVAAQLQACACVAIPSLWPEPYGRIGPEAFLHGRPAVAFAVGGIHDWLEHGRSGYLVPPGDTMQLSDSLRLLLESPDQRRQMGQHARQMAMDAWNARTHAEQLVSVFQRVRVSGN